MGGYISLPVCVAARCAGVPIEIYELNAVPGKATKYLAPLATTIHTCFDQAQSFLPSTKCTSTAYPMRFALQSPIDKIELLKQLNFTPTRTTILITGGSQGSVFINKAILQWLKFNEYTRPRIQIIHQTGPTDTTNWKEIYNEYEIPALTFSYQDTMETYYHLADIIICRAGAGSLFEAMYLRKKTIVIPLTTRSTSHQKDNARAMQKAYPDLCTVVLESDIKKNNMTFFSAINASIYQESTPK
jgi:UDP-N-acetylglucosamine--N-acetylmuramyl-(pentapeptide) pyrophosphoryl-undecaprenol N-acetylglucosamine transferase